MKLGLQLIGIVGKCFQILALHDDSSSVIGGIHVDSGRGIRDFYFLLFHCNEEPDVQLLGLTGNDADIFLCVEGKTLGDGFQNVDAWGKSLEFVEAIAVGGSVQ